MRNLMQRKQMCIRARYESRKNLQKSQTNKPHNIISRTLVTALGVVYTSAQMQMVYSTAPADLTEQIISKPLNGIE